MRMSSIMTSLAGLVNAASFAEDTGWSGDHKLRRRPAGRGVATHRLSRAPRQRQGVRADQGRVRQAAAALGYAPNAIGRALALGHSTRIGLVVTDLHNHFYGHVIPHLHAELSRKGYELVLLTEASESAPIAEQIVANGLAGVILTTTAVDSALPGRLRERDLPFVYFNRTAPSVESSSVTVDPEPGMSELVQEIVRLGHRHVGAVFGHGRRVPARAASRCCESCSTSTIFA